MKSRILFFALVTIITLTSTVIFGCEAEESMEIQSSTETESTAKTQTESLTEILTEATTKLPTETQTEPSVIISKPIKIEDFSADLTKLDLRNMELTNDDIEPLKYITNLTEDTLKEISMYAGWRNSDAYTYIESLKHMPNLTELYLSGNKISDISAVVMYVRIDISTITEPGYIITEYMLSNLKVLDLSDNEIEDISGLSNFTNLTILNLSDNKISDISTLKYIWDTWYESDGTKRKLNLTELNLSGNPLSDAQIAELQDALQGCEIIF